MKYPPKMMYLNYMREVKSMSIFKRIWDWLILQPPAQPTCVSDNEVVAVYVNDIPEDSVMVVFKEETRVYKNPHPLLFSKILDLNQDSKELRNFLDGYEEGQSHG